MNISRLKELIVEEKNHDPQNEELWWKIFNEKKEILCENLQDTLQFIDSCTQDEFFWISNAFDDISKKYQSQKFIDCLQKNKLRFPELNDKLECEIQNAIAAMQDR